MSDFGVAHVPTGAVLVGAAYGDPAYSQLAPSGAALATSANDENWDGDPEPERCAAQKDDGRCKNNHKADSLYCGIHHKFYEALDSLEIP